MCFSRYKMGHDKRNSKFNNTKKKYNNLLGNIKNNDMDKIVYCLTTKENMTFTKDEEGNVTDEFDTDKFQFLLCRRAGRFLCRNNLKDVYQLGYFTRMYVEKVKKEYPELYNN